MPKASALIPCRLFRSPLTGLWYLVTDWTDLGNGMIEANKKYLLPDPLQRILNAWQQQSKKDGQE